MTFHEYKLASLQLRFALAEWKLQGSPGGTAAGLRFAETGAALAESALRGIAAKYPAGTKVPTSVAGWLRS